MVFMAWGAHAQKMCAGVDKVCTLDHQSFSRRMWLCAVADGSEETSRPVVGASVAFGSEQGVLWEWSFQKGQRVVGRAVWTSRGYRLGVTRGELNGIISFLVL